MSEVATTAARILFLADGEIVRELHGADEREVLTALAEIMRP